MEQAFDLFQLLPFPRWRFEPFACKLEALARSRWIPDHFWGQWPTHLPRSPTESAISVRDGEVKTYPGIDRPCRHRPPCPYTSQ